MPNFVKLYGIDGSQPYRSLKWVMMLKDIDFEEVITVPGGIKANGTRHQSFLKMNPAGTVPLIDDEGFFLWESHAIMIYLAEKHQWTDLYPTNIQKRALVNQWLHWHHHNSRTFTLSLFAPFFRPDIQFSEKALEAKKKGLAKTAGLLNEHLKNKDYFVGEQLTLADFAIYGDLGQLADYHLNLFDFSGYPALRAWMERMREVPKYEEAHAVMPMLLKMLNKAKAKI